MSLVKVIKLKLKRLTFQLFYEEIISGILQQVLQTHTYHPVWQPMLFVFRALCLSLPSLVHIPVLLGSHTKRSWKGMCASWLILALISSRPLRQNTEQPPHPVCRAVKPRTL